MSNDEFRGGQFTWFTGIVEDVQDPEYLNRVRVRCLGFYDEEVAVEDLPWATVMMPTTTASVQGNGSNHHLEIGSWVVGFFRDGKSAQDPLVMGSIATQSKNEEEEDSDIPETGFLNSPTGNFVKDIPGEVGSSWDNKVYRSKAGHIIQLDNTENKEKIRISHGTESSEILMDENGNTEIYSSAGLIRLRNRSLPPLAVTGSRIEIYPGNGGDVFVKTEGGSINLDAQGAGGTVNIRASKIRMNTAASIENFDIPKVESIDPFDAATNTKETVEAFLGSSIDDREMDMLIRAVSAEATTNPAERAGVAAVILNRVRSDKFPNTIEGVLTQRNQFQGVTGVPGERIPSSLYSEMSTARGQSIEAALNDNLSSASTEWLNFTAADPAAYGPGTNIAFLDKVKNVNGASQLGGTWFGTV